jgi:CheY-like chemotaxis protein
LKTILVVDDEQASAEVLGLILEDEGYRVYSAANGEAGLARARELQPDLVILDYMMPIMNGAEVGLALRAAPEFCHTRILMNSSLPESAVAQRFNGYDRFLRKPYDIDTVLATIAELLADR